MRPTRTILLVVVLCLGFAACGDDDADATSDTPGDDAADSGSVGDTADAGSAGGAADSGSVDSPTDSSTGQDADSEDSDGGPIDDSVECTSGPCCGRNLTFKSPDVECGRTTRSECVGGTVIQHGVDVQYCSGTSAQCDGEIAPTSWDPAEACPDGQGCCDDACVPLDTVGHCGGCASCPRAAPLCCGGECYDRRFVGDATTSDESDIFVGHTSLFQEIDEKAFSYELCFEVTSQSTEHVSDDNIIYYQADRSHVSFGGGFAVLDDRVAPALSGRRLEILLFYDTYFDEAHFTSISIDGSEFDLFIGGPTDPLDLSLDENEYPRLDPFSIADTGFHIERFAPPPDSGTTDRAGGRTSVELQ